MENRNRRWVRLGTHRKTKQNRMEEINVNKEERVEGKKTWASSGAEELVVTTTFPALPNSEVRERKSTVHGWPFSKERNTYGTHDVTGSSFPFLKIVIYIFFLLLLFLYASLYAIAALQTRQRSSLSIRPWRTAKGRRMVMMCRNKRKDRGRLVLISKWNETFVALRDILFVSAMFCWDRVPYCRMIYVTEGTTGNRASKYERPGPTWKRPWWCYGVLAANIWMATARVTVQTDGKEPWRRKSLMC